jgi:hypothetical protein
MPRCHFPNIAVMNPASFRFSGRNVSFSGMPQGLSHQMTFDCVPRRMVYRPVIRAERVGEQIGCT